MAAPEAFDDVLAIAMRYAETGDADEIAAAVMEMGAVDEEQALAIMRGSGNELSPVEELVSLSVIQFVITRSEAVRIMDLAANHSPGARP
ncbi:hypothetical protein G6L37_02845 [Agrobacterium rubi]|nr:hypothetical protein [Agrobacterium rubi]NTF24315.1 hypothetical protein [Agrobacterium rubi]